MNMRGGDNEIAVALPPYVSSLAPTSPLGGHDAHVEEGGQDNNVMEYTYDGGGNVDEEDDIRGDESKHDDNLTWSSSPIHVDEVEEDDEDLGDSESDGFEEEYREDSDDDEEEAAVPIDVEVDNLPQYEAKQVDEGIRIDLTQVPTVSVVPILDATNKFQLNHLRLFEASLRGRMTEAFYANDLLTLPDFVGKDYCNTLPKLTNFVMNMFSTVLKQQIKVGDDAIYSCFS